MFVILDNKTRLVQFTSHIDRQKMKHPKGVYFFAVRKGFERAVIVNITVLCLPAQARKRSTGKKITRLIIWRKRNYKKGTRIKEGVRAERIPNLPPKRTAFEHPDN